AGQRVSAPSPAWRERAGARVFRNARKRPALLLAALLTTLLLCGAGAAAGADASADPAAQLGASLTPVGAERAGNADGSIPPWTGGFAAPASDPDGKGA